LCGHGTLAFAGAALTLSVMINTAPTGATYDVDGGQQLL
jgi:hypothetical protein